MSSLKWTCPCRCPSSDLGGPRTRRQLGAAHAAGVRARIHVQPAPEAELAGPRLRTSRAACECFVYLYTCWSRCRKLGHLRIIQSVITRQMEERLLGGQLNSSDSLGTCFVAITRVLGRELSEDWKDGHLGNGCPGSCCLRAASALLMRRFSLYKVAEKSALRSTLSKPETGKTRVGRKRSSLGGKGLLLPSLLVSFAANEDRLPNPPEFPLLQMRTGFLIPLSSTSQLVG